MVALLSSVCLTVIVVIAFFIFVYCCTKDITNSCIDDDDKICKNCPYYPTCEYYLKKIQGMKSGNNRDDKDTSL